jgi:large conductance mechanosensitive channel
VAVSTRIFEFDPTRKAFSLVDEFKRFAVKGNVIDLAVGVIIGGAFGNIVDSLLKNIVMPLVSVLLPRKQAYMEWKWVVDGKPVPYRLFIGQVVNFLIVSLALFVFIVKFVGWLTKSRTDQAHEPPLSKDQQRPREIRDLLKERSAP